MAATSSYHRRMGRSTGTARTTTEVLHHHLQLRLDGDLERDLRENYAEDVLVLSGFATYRGHEGVRQSAAQLAEAIEGGSFTYARTVIEDEYAFLEWTARDGDMAIADGADSFRIVDGRIVFQSIHYTALER